MIKIFWNKKKMKESDHWRVLEAGGLQNVTGTERLERKYITFLCWNFFQFLSDNLPTSPWGGSEATDQDNVISEVQLCPAVLMEDRNDTVINWSEFSYFNFHREKVWEPLAEICFENDLPYLHIFIHFKSLSSKSELLSGSSLSNVRICRLSLSDLIRQHTRHHIGYVGIFTAFWHFIDQTINCLTETTIWHLINIGSYSVFNP